MSYAGFGNLSPVTVKKNILTIDKFKGVDLTSPSANVNIQRSPEAPNMIRDIPGKVRKRMGYHKTGAYDGAVNGVHFLNGKKIVHAGTKLYYGDEVIYSDMNDGISRAWQVSGKLYILDGKTFLCFGEHEEGAYSIKAVSEIATVPLIVANRSPSNGGGTPIDPINLLSAGFTEGYLGDGSTKAYQLTAKDLDSTEVTVEKMNSDGQWDTLTENTDFTVNRSTGVVTFTSAPSIPPISGNDNVKITAYKTREGYAERINKCSVSILYGVSGMSDRLFVSGNSEYKNQDWYSQMDDPTYFGDTWYGTIGQDDAPIVGYSIINNYLATHKDGSADGRNIVMRYGKVNDSNEAVFEIVNNILGEGAVGKNTFAYMNEPLFATELGIYAVTAADITGEKYSQNRSFYINGALESENLKNAFAFVYKDFYLLATEKRIYVLDSLQKIYEKSAPYSSFQYECYYWEIPNVCVMWEEDEALCIGKKDGKTYMFYTDKDDPASFNDDGEAISARWDIPDLNGNNFYKNKTFRYISVRLASAIATGVKIYAQSRGLWSIIADAQTRARYFDFGYVDFEKINFSSDSTPRTIGNKIKVKKVDKARFSLRNSELNEPFGIYNVAFEYTESGNFKG